MASAPKPAHAALASFGGDTVPIALLGGYEPLVRDIQDVLSRLGYLDPPSDGKFGPVTNWALRQFCYVNGLSTGKGFTKDVAAALMKPEVLLPEVTQDGSWFDKVVAYMAKNNHFICRHPSCQNIVYIEGANADGTLNDDKPNVFNDLRIVFSVGPDGVPVRRSWDATTEPGHHYTIIKPMNKGGAARIAFGQYKSWIYGEYSGHDALLQVEPIKIHRDLDKNFKRPGDATMTGVFGMHHHWGYDAQKHDIGKASAGCLVGRTRNGHREFMSLLSEDVRYKANRAYRFVAAILPGDEVL